MIKNWFNILVLFCAILSGINVVAQGNTCGQAVPVSAGLFTGDGPLDGEGVSEGCFPTVAANSDWYVYTP